MDTLFNFYQKILIKFFLFAPILLIFGCSGDSIPPPVSDNSGAITFEIKWPQVDYESELKVAALSTAEISCLSGLVTTIIFAIYDKDNNLIVDLEDATFDCSDGEGIVEKVPAGTGIRLVVIAKGKGVPPFTASEIIYLRGEHPGDITVENAKTTALGVIETYDYIPELSEPHASESIDLNDLSFEWDDVTGATSYKITFTRQIPSGENPKEYITSDTNFSPPSSENNFFVEEGSYTWYVTAIDDYGNYGSASVSRHFTISD